MNSYALSALWWCIYVSPQKNTTSTYREKVFCCFSLCGYLARLITGG